MSEHMSDHPELKKSMGPAAVLALGVGAMVGFGWVILVGDWITSAGSIGAMLAFAVGGAMMALMAYIYSELVAAMPQAGGEHNYIIRALGPRWSLIGSWAIAGGYATVVAFEAVALPRALSYVVNLDHIKLYTVAESDVYLVWALVGSVSAVIITLINILGAKIAGSVQIFVVVFLFAIGALQLIGMFSGGEGAKMEPLFSGGAAGFFAVLIIVPFMFVGFDVIPQTAEEANMKPRSIGRISVISVLIAAAWYILIVLTVSVALDDTELQAAGLPAADAMGALFGNNFVPNLMVAAGVAGIITSWNSLQMGASRLLFSLARGGMLPKWLGVVHPKFGTPINALLLLGFFATIAPFFGRAALVWVVDAGSPMIVIAYLMVMISFVVLRKRDPEMPRPLRIGGSGNGGLYIGYLAIVVALFLVALYLPFMPAGSQISWQSWAIFGVWWIAGIIFMLRIPPGIAPGPDAEHKVIEQMKAQGKL
ncbi:MULTISPECIES: APC family permease [Rothia]|uniref:Amino acid permease n=1 Tax=Rothia nasimurium TaxID=85336 RepID=A0A1Y1RQR3_9MICC|nr:MULTISPECIES: APC family permease [Rothia]ORC22125.1 amino acid permease [Rothia nasimurium]